MEITRLLEEIGLTKNETKVYLSLLKIGVTTTSALIKDTGINTSKVYESLERLLKKGLVSYAIIKNKKHWVGESPKKINEFLDEEKKKIEDKEQLSKQIIPKLLSLKNLNKSPVIYSVFEGIKGVKTAREKVFDELKKGDTLYVILANYPKIEKMEGYWMDFQERRTKKGIKCKYIFNENLREIGEKRIKLKLADARYVKSDALSPMWIEIYGNHVGIGVMGNNPSIFLINSSDVANGFTSYFNSLWKTGEK